MQRRAGAVIAVALLAGVGLGAWTSPVSAQDCRSSEPPTSACAPAKQGATRIPVRVVTPGQLNAPVRPSATWGRLAPATVGRSMHGRTDSTSLFDALVAPGGAAGGFDGPPTTIVLPPAARIDISAESSYAGPVPGSLSPAAAAEGGAYLLGPGDVIEVFVWRNPELSREVPVRPDGRISLPLVGEVIATGKSADQLQVEVTEALGQYVQMPTVTVSVKQIRSLVVYVLGNVTKPGPVQMERNLTVLQAIAMAGGLNEFANRKDIVVLRTDEFGAHQRLAFRYDDVVAGRDLLTNLSLRAGDVIYIP